jgi:hypothetical protein
MHKVRKYLETHTPLIFYELGGVPLTHVVRLQNDSAIRYVSVQWRVREHSHDGDGLTIHATFETQFIQAYFHEQGCAEIGGQDVQKRVAESS